MKLWLITPWYNDNITWDTYNHVCVAAENSKDALEHLLSHLRDEGSSRDVEAFSHPLTSVIEGNLKELTEPTIICTDFANA